MVIENQMQHLKDNALCAIAIETTGPKAGYHDLIGIAIILLDNYIEISNNHVPFYLDIKPKRIENINVNYKEVTVTKPRLCEIIECGVDPYSAADRFEEWHTGLHLKFRKKIVPLAYDWPSIRPFIQDWLGWEGLLTAFGDEYRDVKAMALMANDKANFYNESAPFPKTNFYYLCSQLKIGRDSVEDAMLRASTTSKVYKRILQTLI